MKKLFLTFITLVAVVAMSLMSVYAATSEKPAADNTIHSSMQPLQSSSDPEWQRICQEEDYIVQLINGLGQSTDRAGWQFNLNFLKTNIDSIRQIPGVNMDYVNDYIQAYDLVTQNEAMGNSRQNISPRVTYDFTSAVNYANQYYSTYNTAYPSWDSLGGDCANFISQCLYAGGKAMVGVGGTASDFNNWFSSGTTQNTNLVSSTWRGADDFRNFWQVHCTKYSKFTAVDATSYAFGWTGDAITLLDSNGRGIHTLIIVGYATGNDFVIAAHTGSTNSTNLSTIYNEFGGGYLIYNMR